MMPKVVEVLVKKEHHGQVWYEAKPVEKADDAEGKAGRGLGPSGGSLPKPPSPLE